MKYTSKRIIVKDGSKILGTTMRKARTRPKTNSRVRIPDEILNKPALTGYSVTADVKNVQDDHHDKKYFVVLQARKLKRKH